MLTLPLAWLQTRLRCGDRGATMVEYALMVALIALVCVAAVDFLGGATDGSLANSGSLLSEAGQP